MNVIIAGAGIGGLAAGVALRRAGAGVMLLERATSLRVGGAGLVLWANAVRGLRHLGIHWRNLEGEVVRTSEVCAANGRLLSRFDVRSADGQVGGVSLVVCRSRLLRVLREAFERGGGAVRFGAGLESLGPIEDEHGRPVAPSGVLTDGSRVRSDIMVGAEGVGSVVFAGLHPESVLKPTGETCWRFVVPWEADDAIPRGLMREVWGRGRRFGINRLDEKRVFCWAMGRRAPGVPADELDHHTRLREWYRDWGGAVPELIERAGDAEILCHDIADRPPLRRWGRGLVTVLGDAAHPTTPHLGQSGCMAIEDAEALGRWVGGLLMRLERTPAAMEGALRGYEAVRLGRTARITRLSHRVGRVGMLRSRIACGVRDAVMGAIPARVQRHQHAWLTGAA